MGELYSFGMKGGSMSRIVKFAKKIFIIIQKFERCIKKSMNLL